MMVGMSRKLLVFLLSELVTVRLVCKQCQATAAVEVPLGRLGQQAVFCPSCRTPFGGPIAGMPNYLDELARVIAQLQHKSVPFEVEFVLPDKGGGAAP